MDRRGQANMAGTGGSVSATARLNAALTKPLCQRCPEIAKIIEDTSTKELHVLFPVLVDSIFGFNNQPGWGLHRLSRSQYQDFKALQDLMGANGSLMGLVYRLLADPYYKYEFPISCLPLPSQHMIDEGAIPAFYVEKLQYYQGQGRPYSMLSLNAFEYYFIHFAYMLVNPQMQKTSCWTNPNEAAYPILLESYLNQLLPADGRPVQPMRNVAPPVRSPVAHPSPHYRHPTGSVMSHGPVFGQRGYHSSHMLRGQVYMQYHGAQQVAPSPSTTMLDYTEQETWRSQTFLQILVEFWLNQHSLDSDKYGFTQHSSESFLPSSDHVRVVRMLIKHLHYFVNSGPVEVMTSPYHQPNLSPLDEFKRLVIPQLVQKRLYAFLKHGFERWPLDSSFRLMLETWLSFLQPWRYTDIGQTNKEHEMKDKSVDDKWGKFVSENLLFYTVLFHAFINRAFRLDLSSPKNAYMLFRVCKVYCVQNLKRLIEDAECIIYEPVHSLSHSAIPGSPDIGASYMPQQQRHAIFNMLFAELEGPGFQYIPLFYEGTEDLIRDLLCQLSQAKVTAACSQKSTTDSGTNTLLSWLGFGPMIDYNASKFYYAEGYDDYGGSDIKKLGVHLDQSIGYLCKLFQVAPPDEAGKKVSFGDKDQSPKLAETLPPDFVQTEDGPVLTPLGRYQLMNGLRRFDVGYRGDPDLQPVRSFESVTLVRSLHHLSSFVNQRFAAQIRNIYEREGFMARVARQFISPSVTKTPPSPVSKLTASPMSPHQCHLAEHPRISLRWLGSYQNLAYIFMFYLVATFWLGIGVVGFAFLFILVVLLYGVSKALVMSSQKVKER